jgi:hypothetical protein
MIESYFSNIESVLNNCEFIERYEISKQKINNLFGTVNGKVFFRNGILHFLEVVRISEQHETQKKKYKYHFMKNDLSIIFRYDNMPHHPKVNTFPHHKHIKGSIIESQEPELILILKEIKDTIL